MGLCPGEYCSGGGCSGFPSSYLGDVGPDGGNESADSPGNDAGYAEAVAYTATDTGMCDMLYVRLWTPSPFTAEFGIYSNVSLFPDGGLYPEVLLASTAPLTTTAAPGWVGLPLTTDGGGAVPLFAGVVYWIAALTPACTGTNLVWVRDLDAGGFLGDVSSTVSATSLPGQWVRSSMAVTNTAVLAPVEVFCGFQ